MIVVVGTSEDDVGKALGNWYIKTHKIDFAPPYAAIGFCDDNGVKGVALFTNYNGSNVDVHYAGKGSMTRFNFRAVLRYAFNQLKCNRLTVKPAQGRRDLNKYCRRLGFKYEYTLKNYYGLLPGEDAVMYCMFPEQAKKWIELDGHSR